ncbi:MAG: hypothetical protein ABIP43_10185 [Nitrospiraceae bacterium]
MTVRREIAEPRRETSAWSREDPMRARAARGGSEGVSPLAEGLSQQRIGDCRRSVHE